MVHALVDFPKFVDSSPTAFHACREISNRLLEADFIPLSEKEKWKFEPGKGYFLTREDSLVAAFRIPLKPPTKTTLLSSHLDSPALKLKPHPETISQEIGRFSTEIYGSPLLHTWLDRNLVIAGKISVLNANGKLETLLVALDDYLVTIPGLALHLDRAIMEKGLQIQKEDHLKPIFSLKAENKQLEAYLHKHHSFKKMLSADLFLVPAEKGSFLGFDGELFCSYRLDNLTSAYASLYALLMAEKPKESLQAVIFWDHEEIGSKSYTGADSLFADQLFQRICYTFKMDLEDYWRFKSRSLNLSIDASHGFHPNFSDKFDLKNAAYLGKGPALKFNAGQKYASSSETASPIIRLAEKENLPIQMFASRSDIPSGSTVGSMMAATLGIKTVDLGVPLWAMHSTRETMAIEDELTLCKLLKSALENLELED